MSPEGGPLSVAVRARVNGRECAEAVPPRLLLCDFLRSRLRLTGTHVGCEHGVCGACTVLLDGEPVRSCLLLAAQVDGREVTTVEGLAPDAEAPSSGSASVSRGAWASVRLLHPRHPDDGQRAARGAPAPER